MEEKNELNDIILNRSNGNNGMKKIMLAVAALAVLLIIVVVIMSSLNSSGMANLPQAIEPPKNIQSSSIKDEDPLFEPIAIDETPSTEDSLDSLAKKIKAQSEEYSPLDEDFIEGPENVLVEETDIFVPAKYEKPVPKVVKKALVRKSVPKKKVVSKPAIKGNFYVQVGSFGRFTPEKKFLTKITSNGYTYIIHKVSNVTKVLVGPYSTDQAARKELRTIRSKIEPGAFLSRI
ncbi:MAG TPA: SPOR domain-containing protein [Sulfurimonas sp.]|nr:SPOR domain-containing protein [Sulfurimonas sp.]